MSLCQRLRDAVSPIARALSPGNIWPTCNDARLNNNEHLVNLDKISAVNYAGGSFATFSLVQTVSARITPGARIRPLYFGHRWYQRKQVIRRAAARSQRKNTYWISEIRSRLFVDRAAVRNVFSKQWASMRQSAPLPLRPSLLIAVSFRPYTIRPWASCKSANPDGLAH